MKNEESILAGPGPGSAAVSTLCIGCDQQTGFPYVEFREGLFVSLLPLAKLQVEQFISSGAAAATRMSPVQVRELQAYVEQFYGGRQYVFKEVARLSNRSTPKVTDILRRRPLGDTLVEESLLATNIPHQQAGEEWEDQTCVPSPGSAMTFLLGWLGARGLSREGHGPGARLPSSADYQQFRRQFVHCAGTYLKAALARKKHLELNRTAAVLMQWLCQSEPVCRPAGLPFLESGVWELTCDSDKYEVWAGREARTHFVPLAVGRCRFLPPLCQRNEQPRRILTAHHPCLGIRPVLARENLRQVISVTGEELDFNCPGSLLYSRGANQPRIPRNSAFSEHRDTPDSQP